MHPQFWPTVTLHPPRQPLLPVPTNPICKGQLEKIENWAFNQEWSLAHSFSHGQFKISMSHIPDRGDNWRRQCEALLPDKSTERVVCKHARSNPNWGHRRLNILYGTEPYCKLDIINALCFWALWVLIWFFPSVASLLDRLIFTYVLKTDIILLSFDFFFLLTITICCQSLQTNLLLQPLLC